MRRKHSCAFECSHVEGHERQREARPAACRLPGPIDKGSPTGELDGGHAKLRVSLGRLCPEGLRLRATGTGTVLHCNAELNAELNGSSTLQPTVGEEEPVELGKCGSSGSTLEEYTVPLK